MKRRTAVFIAFLLHVLVYGCGGSGGPPDTMITVTPLYVEGSNQAIFTFGASGGGESFECRLDGGAWVPCEPPLIYSDLSDGSHTFEVRAIDDKGNADPEPAGFFWEIDTVPPETAIESYPSSPTTSATAQFSFVSNEEDSTFECELDSGDWQPCASPSVFADLYGGIHTLRVRSIDTAGNIDGSPESFAWEVITWVSVSAGHVHTCEIKLDGSLWCWGNNQGGQLGDGTTDNTAIPVPVGSDRDWEQVSSGVVHTCAGKDDGSLWCWGSNEYGQTGDGTGQDALTPIGVAGEGGWVSTTSGGWHSCGVKDDRSLWCWGSNVYGQLGNGTVDDSFAPVRIAPEINWTSVDAGYYHTCGKTTYGTLYCWGFNLYGQLGDGSCGT